MENKRRKREEARKHFQGHILFKSLGYKFGKCERKNLFYEQI
jgi:hypothetical protein